MSSVQSTARTGFKTQRKDGSILETLGFEDLSDAIAHHNSRPAYLLKRSEQALTAMYLARCRAGKVRLTYSQLLVLCALDSSPHIHQAVAARMAGMDEPTTALVTGSLDKSGFVNRRASSEDRRQRILQITARGKAVKSAALNHLADATGEFLSPLSAEERRQLIVLLHKISTNPKSLAPPLCDREGQSVASPDYLPVKTLPAFLIGRCLQIAVSVVGPAVATFGLSIPQYVTLSVLASFEDCDLGRLSRLLGAARSSLAHILTALESRSLVSMRRPQARSLMIDLTPAGLDLLLQVRPAAEEANDVILGNLSVSDRKRFTSLLGRVLKGHDKLMSASE
jgi:DNA-binding MarR family transcriptional regulator